MILKFKVNKVNSTIKGLLKVHTVLLKGYIYKLIQHSSVISSQVLLSNIFQAKSAELMTRPLSLYTIVGIS